MKKIMVAVALLGLSLPATGQGAEFLTPGAVGMGGAGVARNTDAYATYWNPAGLAFYQKTFSTRMNAGLGVNINSSMADNVDKLGKMNVNDLKNLSFSGTSTDFAKNLSASAQAVEFVGIINDLDHNKGTLVATPEALLAFQYRDFGLGLVVTSELGGFPVSDTTSVRPGDPASTTPSAFATGIGATGTVAQGTLFTSAQRTQIVNAFVASGATSTDANNITNKLEVQLQASGSNKSGQTAQQLADAMVHLANSFTLGAGSIENNTSTIELRGLALAEIPVSYGHKFDLGAFGKLGLGASVKVMQGTVFYSSQQIVKLSNSSDVFKKVQDQKTDSISYGVDLGALWRYEDLPLMGPVSVGFVAKNLNSPEFDAYQIAGRSTPKVKVEPQLRAGIALAPFSWLNIAADMDVSRNKTILAGVESQNVGGGVELYASWIALRAGAFKNIAVASSKPIVTGGLSVGPQWLRMDIDAAVATESARYNNTTYPREAKVELGLSTAF